MLKVDGVENVRVSLNEGLTILDLKPGNAVSMARLRQIIKNNGFVSKTAEIVARGAVERQTFVVSGTGEQLAFTATPTRRGDDWLVSLPAPKR
jgi:hypothetical protein